MKRTMSETTSNTIPKASGSTPGGVHLKGRIEEVSHRSEAPVVMAGAIDNKVLAGRPAGQMHAELGSGGLNEAAALNSQEIGADKESATGFVRGVEFRSASRFSKLDIMPSCSWMPRSGGRGLKKAA